MSRSTPTHQALLSLGSNIEPERHLVLAVRLLGEAGRLVRVSRVWQSPPFGFRDQADFLNAAVWLETPHTAEELIASVIPSIEARLGRKRDPANKNGPRTIDIDLSLFDDVCGEILGRTIPDPAIGERLFVARPLADIAPDWVDARTGRTLRVVAERLAHQSPPLMQRTDLTLLPSAAASEEVS